MSGEVLGASVVSLLAGAFLWNWWIYGRHRRRARYPPDWETLSRAVYQRAGHHCQNCQRQGVELHAHQIVPLTAGGTNHLSNLACLCRDCHRRIHVHMRD